MRKITDKREKEILSKKLLSVEAALNTTGKELARICDVSDSTIYRIEGRLKSDAAISEKMILKICEKTGVDPDWMLDFSSVDFTPVFTSKGILMSMDGKSPAERVKILRTDLGMSQIEFCKLIETGSGSLGDIETGRNKLTEQMAKKIEAKCEHGGAEWLLTGNERNRHYPVGDEMIEWLKNHQKERERIWKLMRDV